MTRSPLRNLVLFLIGLALFGTIISGVHYIAIDIPGQNAVPPPANYDAGGCARCMASCTYQFWDDSCVNNCVRSCECNPHCYYE